MSAPSRTRPTRAGQPTPPPARGRPEPARSRRLSGTAFAVLVTALVLGAALSTILAVGVGPVRVPLGVTAAIIAHHVAPDVAGPAGTPVQNQIVWDLRLPRAVLALLVGAGLAAVGTVLQAVVRNPLADPFLLGVSGGAAFGAVSVLVLGSGAVGGLSLSVAAFAGGLVATAAVYLLAQRRGRVTPTRLILAGVAIAYLFQAGYSYLLVTAPNPQGLQGVLFWLLGSLAAVRWDGLAVPTAVLAAGSVLLLVEARPLNALLTGDDGATSLGIDVQRLRIRLVVVTSLLTGVMVAVSGAIAFVGLIVPHFVRLLVGSDHRRVLPVALLIGAVFLQLVDTLARTVRPPVELPLSIVTAAVGVPFFLWLLRRQDRSGEASAA